MNPINEEGLIIMIKRDPDLRQRYLKNPKELQRYVINRYPFLNIETVMRYRREYESKLTPTENKMNNKPDWITFPHEKN
jgi:hypothetical protein